MKGKATQKKNLDDGRIKYKPIPSIDVWSNIGMADALTELRTQRLNWFQMICGHPLHHQLYVTAMVGRFPHDTSETEISHPWLQQLMADLQELSSLEGACFLDGVP
eukprot:7943814-Pyramimonas_sp.AAC.1